MGNSKSVGRARLPVKSEFDGESDNRDYLTGAHAWNRMQDRITPSIAEHVNLSRQLLEDFGNPHRRRRGPHMLLAEVLEFALHLKSGDEQRANVLAPLDYVEARIGRIAIDVAKARAGTAPASRAQKIAVLCVQFAQLVDAVDDPQALDARGRLYARQQLQEVIDEALGLIGDFKEPTAPAPAPDGSNVAALRSVK